MLLEYVREADPIGQQVLLRLTEYSRATWERLPAATHGPPDHCWTRDEIALPAGRAVLFSGFESPDDVPPGPGDPCPGARAPDRFFAHAFLGETVVVVSPWQWEEQSRGALEAVLRAIAPRMPGGG